MSKGKRCIEQRIIEQLMEIDSGAKISFVVRTQGVTARTI
jgi:hypothetical protein